MATVVAVIIGGTNSNIYGIYSPANNSDLDFYPWGSYMLEPAGGPIQVYRLTRAQFDSYPNINALQIAFKQPTKPGVRIY